MSARHSLVEKNPADRTARCVLCGPVAMVPAGRGWACVVARRESRRNYKKAHPERARAGRAHNPSAHRLTLRTGEPDTCAVCGPVKPDAWGRGWICPTLRVEKGWPNTQTAPAPKCQLCNKQWLVDGLCPSCERITEDLADMYIPAESRRARKQSLADMYEAAGFSIVTEDPALPTGVESAVPGWKTLGSPEPSRGVRPEYARLFGSGTK